jgi:hypothetical protein
MGGGETAPPGTLTITGIPAEYEGKLVSWNVFRISVTNNQGKKSDITVEDTAVKNGEVKLLIYYAKSLLSNPFSKPDGYAGNDTVPAIEIRFYSTSGGLSMGTDAVFESVTFENGVAAVQWNNAAKAGYITVTDIPAEYNGREAEIDIGWKGLSATAVVDTPLRNLTVSNGTITGKIYPKEGDKYISYTFTGAKDIMVHLGNGKERTSALSFITIGLSPYQDHFLFKNVQITNGKADIDFRRGVKQ